jgi:plasmid maintenance system killer protein
MIPRNISPSRMTFTFDGEDAILVDYQDYH